MKSLKTYASVFGIAIIIVIIIIVLEMNKKKRERKTESDYDAKAINKTLKMYFNCERSTKTACFMIHLWTQSIYLVGAY